MGQAAPDDEIEITNAAAARALPLDDEIEFTNCGGGCLRPLDDEIEITNCAVAVHRTKLKLLMAKLKLKTNTTACTALLLPLLLVVYNAKPLYFPRQFSM